MPSSTDEKRRARILEAAGELFLRFGYDKTTVGEIAERAGVSKGAIYLHFDSKDDLFEAVLTAEIADYSERWVELIEEDPEGGTIGGIYENVLYALEENEFVAAMLKGDKQILGSYMKKEDSLLRQGHSGSHREEFVEMMQQIGAMRRDIDPEIVAHIMNLLSYGLVAIGDVMDEEEIPPVGEVIKAIGTIFDRALTPEDGGNGEEVKRILRQQVEAGREQMEQSDDSETE
jgi:TetR/AcrR family acrAB operon transcriptional repressor